MAENPLDEHFYDRADCYIDVANNQCKSIGRGKVSASFMYALARFNAYVSATGFQNVSEIREQRAVIIDYFVDQYRKNLEDNLDEYIENFDQYMKRPT